MYIQYSMYMNPRGWGEGSLCTQLSADFTLKNLNILFTEIRTGQKGLSSGDTEEKWRLALGRQLYENSSAETFQRTGDTNHLLMKQCLLSRTARKNTNTAFENFFKTRRNSLVSTLAGAWKMCSLLVMPERLSDLFKENCRYKYSTDLIQKYFFRIFGSTDS